MYKNLQKKLIQHLGQNNSYNISSPHSSPQKKSRMTFVTRDFLLSIISDYLTSSKTTLTDYQCVSTGCCTHAAKTEITIDNQHVTNITAKVYIFTRITKRKHRKNHKSATFS